MIVADRGWAGRTGRYRVGSSHREIAGRCRNSGKSRGDHWRSCENRSKWITLNWPLEETRREVLAKQSELLVQSISPLVESKSENVQKFAARAIGNLCYDHGKYIDDLRSLLSIFSLQLSIGRPSTRRERCWRHLFRCCFQKMTKYNAILLVSDFLVVFINMFQQEHLPILHPTTVSNCLTILSDYNGVRQDSRWNHGIRSGSSIGGFAQVK